MRVHATVVAIGGRGVMLTGPSGSGKSDLALRLIDRGATLVGDDYVDLFVEQDQLVAKPVETIAGRLEIREVGIVNFPNIASAPIALGLDLSRPGDRLPEPEIREFSGLAVNFTYLSAFESAAPIKVEQALKLHGLALERSLR